MSNSPEFLEEILREAKDKLPGWAYAPIFQIARARAGGRVAHKVDEPDVMSKLAMSAFTEKKIQALSDDELKSVWKKIGAWFKNASKRKQETDGFLKAARLILNEAQTRKLKFKGEQLKEALEPKVEKELEPEVVTQGPTRAVVAFVGAYPSHIDKARKEPFTGTTGALFKQKYLEPLELKREDVLLTNVFPVVLKSEQDICDWEGWIKEELYNKAPRIIITLGKEARQILGDKADFNLPHPTAVQKHGDSGEIDRKLKQIAKKIKEQKQVVKKMERWEKFWTKVVKEENKSNLIAIVMDNGESALLFSDCIIPILKNSEIKTEMVDFTFGIVQKDLVELFLDNGTNLDRYLLQAPKGAAPYWTIEKTADTKPIAETGNPADYISGLDNSHDIVFWGLPNQPLRKIDVASCKEIPKFTTKISKALKPKQIVYGVVLDPYGKKGAQPDAHNDWMPPAEIEKAAHAYLKNSRVVGLQHKNKANAKVVESWVEQYPDKQYEKAMRGESHKVFRRKFGNDFIHSGSWLMGVELSDKEWDLYQKGEINAFSPGGHGLRRPLSPSQMPHVEFIDVIERRS
jgi:uracil-DNA glycosylase family 4